MSKKSRVRLIPLAATLLVGLIPVSAAQGAAVSRPGFSATVTASVTPTRLPTNGTAPVQLTIRGSSSRTDFTNPMPLRSINLRLDRQITIDTEGLPLCSVSDVDGAFPTQARKKCGRALIGSGTTDETYRFPDTPPFDWHYTMLFFNTWAAGRPQVLMYVYSSDLHIAGVGPIGAGRNLRLDIGDSAAAEVSYQFRFGKTWHYQGERHSYLSGQCRTGTLKNRITLALSDGEVSDTSPQRCTKRAAT